MRRTAGACAALVFAGAGYLQAIRTADRTSPAARPAAGPQTVASGIVSPDPAASHRALLNQYCVTCHNQRLKTAGLTLDTVDLAHADAQADVWEKVIRKVRTGAMPPASAPRPTDAARTSLVSWLQTTLDHAAAATPNPGRPSLHRLNRAEYANAIHDLLALDVEVRALLPADTSSFGFDNVGDVLSVGPALLERYLEAAKAISRVAVGDPTLRPTIATYHPAGGISLRQDQRMDESLPFGSRGGIAIRHHFPLDGEYSIKLTLQRPYFDINPRGITDKEQIDVRLDGERLKLFAIGGRAAVDSYGVDQDHELEDAGLVLRVHVKAGPRVIGVTFPQRTWAPEGVALSKFPTDSSSFLHARHSDTLSGRADMGIDTVDIEGPFNATVPEDSPSRRRIFVCRPATPRDEEPCARTILTTLARRAYRRPVTTTDVNKLLAAYQDGRKEGRFDNGIEWALERMLVSPHFLFRVEADPAGVPRNAPYAVSDVELASRLSFFLWSSIPDDQLLDLATRGQLRNPAVLEQQVRRMLRDDRSRSIITNFFGQWLYVRNMNAVRPNPNAFIEFDENLREAFERETEMFLESQVRENRSALELLTASYTFLNERLAQHYGIPNVYGSHFRRVTLAGGQRAGVLGHGSVLTVTSYAHRTSPVLRGKWLLENVLGSPPPPPPANVPPLPENGEGKAPTSVRERMEQHRKNPVCASCHAKMDPLGFALENFDAIGRWRETEANAPIDASGVMPDGAPFKGNVEFRAVLQQHRTEFAEVVVGKLLTYALGRGVEYYDMPAVRKIVAEVAPGDYRWSSLILSIVKSLPFQMRRSES